MKKKFCALMVLLASAAQMYAEDAITATSLTIPQGGTSRLEIELINPEGSYGGFEFELKLPAGISATKIEKANRLTAIEDYSLGMSLTDETNNIYQVLGYNINRQSIAGTSGSIAYITLSASAELAIETVLDCILQNVTISTIDLEQTYAQDATFTITIGQPVDSRVVLNEESTTAPVAATNVDVRVIRTINANEWSTIVLPFAMTETQVKEAFGDGVELSDFTGYDYDEDNDKITINFQDVTAIEANHPYIIKVSQRITEFTADGVVVDPEDVPVVTYGWTTGRGAAAVYHPMDFIGTYVADFNIYNDAQRKALFLSGNSFYYAIESTLHMKAFRAYFDFDDVVESDEAGSRITMSFADDATGIRTVGSKDSDVYYNLQGQPVAKPSKGLYIRNNKVVIVK